MQLPIKHYLTQFPVHFPPSLSLLQKLNWRKKKGGEQVSCARAPNSLQLWKLNLWICDWIPVLKWKSNLQWLSHHRATTGIACMHCCGIWLSPSGWCDGYIVSGYLSIPSGSWPNPNQVCYTFCHLTITYLAVFSIYLNEEDCIAQKRWMQAGSPNPGFSVTCYWVNNSKLVVGLSRLSTHCSSSLVILQCVPAFLPAGAALLHQNVTKARHWPETFMKSYRAFILN